jgi:xylitol oxidase
VASLTNWAGNYTFASRQVHEPETIEELRQIVLHATKLHALGSRHSFNGVADSGEQVSVAKLALPLEIDREARTVTVNAGERYGVVALALEAAGLALHNMASLPHISIGGAIATATHGSGNSSCNLASAVAGLELMTSDGEILQVTRADADFAGMVVGLGALGVVTRVTLNVEPTYQMAQRVYENLSWEVVDTRFDDVMAGASSVSLFTDYSDTVNQVWLKHRVSRDAFVPLPDEYHGAKAAGFTRHPIGELSGEACTAQLGEPGPWLDRLPHFRMDVTPSNGAEIQSEYLLPRHHAPAALRAVRQLGDRIRPFLQISEIRTVAADDLWLSTAWQRDSVGIHFTWKLDHPGVDSVLPEVEAALAPFDPRPHWGKHFLMPGALVAERYERLPEFRQLAGRLDPRGTFRNPFLERHVLG